MVASNYKGSERASICLRTKATLLTASLLSNICMNDTIGCTIHSTELQGTRIGPQIISYIGDK